MAGGEKVRHMPDSLDPVDRARETLTDKWYSNHPAAAQALLRFVADESDRLDSVNLGDQSGADVVIAGLQRLCEYAQMMQAQIAYEMGVADARSNPQTKTG